MRFLVNLILVVGLVVSLSGCTAFVTVLTVRSRGHSSCQVLDQFGTPVAKANVSIKVESSLIRYLNGRETFHVTSEKRITSTNGIFNFAWISTDTQPGPGADIVISKPGFSTNHFYLYPGDFDGDSPRRLMLPKLTGERMPTTKSITSGGGSGLITIRTPWLGKPLYFDLETKSFVESGGDFEISVERADYGDTNKNDRPFNASIRAIDGTLLPCTRLEYYRSFTGCVPSWGTNQSILFHSPNSRSHPNAWATFTFHTRNGKNVGRAAMIIDVIGERKYNDPSKPADTQALVGLEIEAFFNSEGSPLLGDQPLRL